MPLKELKLNLLPKTKRADIYARRDIISRILQGNWATAFKGRGIEFAGFRAYQFGDDASFIDWKASLRSKQVLVKEFEEYKVFNVFFLLDVSDSMLFTSTKEDKLKVEYAAELLYTLADAILRSGDAVGMAMFTDSLRVRVPPNIGMGVAYAIAQKLLDKDNYGGPLDIKKVLLQTRSFLTEKSVVVIISDFLGFEEGWDEYLVRMAENYEMIGIMVRDVRDRELPLGAGQYSLRDPYKNRYLYIDVNHYARLYYEHTLKEERAIINIFKKAQGGCVLVTTDQDYLRPLLRFFHERSFLLKS